MKASSPPATEPSTLSSSLGDGGLSPSWLFFSPYELLSFELFFLRQGCIIKGFWGGVVYLASSGAAFSSVTGAGSCFPSSGAGSPSAGASASSGLVCSPYSGTDGGYGELLIWASMSSLFVAFFMSKFNAIWSSIFCRSPSLNFNFFLRVFILSFYFSVT